MLHNILSLNSLSLQSYSRWSVYSQVVWGLSTPCWTVSSMSSCTLTTAWLPWAPTTRSTCGGRSTSLLFSWYVFESFFFILRTNHWPVICDIGLNPSSHFSPDPVCYGDHPHLPVFLHEGLPLPVPHLHLHHWPVRPDFPVPLPQLLVPRLH